MDSITLSGSEFKALASETRTGLIKLLQQRNHTLSELAQKTSLAAPTIKQHLEILEKAGLVEQADEGRKWKYYSLTKKGKKILCGEEPKNILIVLAAGILGLAATLYSFLGLVWQAEVLPSALPLQSGGDKALGTISTGANETIAPASTGIRETIFPAQQIPLPIEKLIILAVVIVALSILVGFLIAKIRKK